MYKKSIFKSHAIGVNGTPVGKNKSDHTIEPETFEPYFKHSLIKIVSLIKVK